MKKILSILFISLLCVLVQVQAQTTVGFTYDLDGNMIQRKIVIFTSPSVKPENKDTASVSDITGEQKINIYPNPTHGLFKVAIKILDSKQKNYFLLYSLSGTKLQQQNISDINTEINISNYAAGTYLLDVILGDKVSRWKIIKQ